MKLVKGLGDFFGLDIGTNAVRVVQLSRTGAGWSMVHYGYTPADSKITSGVIFLKLFQPSYTIFLNFIVQLYISAKIPKSSIFFLIIPLLAMKYPLFFLQSPTFQL